MREKLKIILMIFALGIFVMPKQSFFAQTVSSCSTSQTMDCCKKDKDHSQKPCDKKEKDSCNDCSVCHTCHHSMVTFAVSLNENLTDLNPVISSKRGIFSYISPEISDVCAKIWQPPKIG